MAVLNITKDNFESDVANSPVPVLVDFWAPWCNPCMRAAPIVDEFASEVVGKVKVGKINIDEEPELAQTFGVMTIPTMMVFKDGKQVGKRIGLCSKEDLKNLVGV